MKDCPCCEFSLLSPEELRAIIKDALKDYAPHIQSISIDWEEIVVTWLTPPDPKGMTDLEYDWAFDEGMTGELTGHYIGTEACVTRFALNHSCPVDW